MQIADVFSKEYSGNPKSPAIQFVALQKSLYITTFICVLGGGFFLATALFIEKDKKAAERMTKGKATRLYLLFIPPGIRDSGASSFWSVCLSVCGEKP